MEFKRPSFSKSAPTVEEIEMRKVVDESKQTIEDAMLLIAKDVAEKQLGVTDIDNLQGLLELLDEHFITIEPLINRVDGKHYVTFSVSMIVSAICLDDV